ncbi:ATP synthase F0 subunit B [Saccharothrix violaceirubra]|uniref:ATP synthase F0 subunit B n=1 Tax=Saccharothrix violaceirubra TaxID=413306 RepID=UPI0016084919|nr:DivIVA domain-containing protein [Saccharothrix violaceirubra]
MYRVFEALDELVTIVEEARGVPMTSGCVVPRGDVLELLDDVRDAIPGELDDAQDVLDHRDELIGKAQHELDTATSKARSDADRIVGEAQHEAERMLSEARARAERMVAEAEDQAQRTVVTGRQEYEDLVGRAHAEADRMIQAGRAGYERAIEEGRAEQSRLVDQTEVVRAAHAESARVVESAQTESMRLRGECDAYVDGKLADFEDLLAHTLRSVGKGRSHLRGPAVAGAAPFDYHD